MARSMEEGGRYRITVAGTLDEDWSTHLWGMAIRMEPGSGRTPFGVMEGTLPDQRALSDVLGRLYELHLPLVSVELLDD